MRALTKEQFKRKMQSFSLKKSGMVPSTDRMINDKTPRLSLFVDGTILHILLSDEYLKTHFTFLCLACHGLIGYNFSPSSKAALIKLIE